MSGTTNTSTGRPLRALAILLVAYVGARTAVLWPPAAVLPESSLPTRVSAIRVPPVAQPDVVMAKLQSPPELPSSVTIPVELIAPPRASDPAPKKALFVGPSVAPLRRQTPVLVEETAQTPAQSSTSPGDSLPTAATPILAPIARTGRWSGSFYAVTRGAGGVGTAPLLGGTQAGVRVYRMVGRTLGATASFAASPGTPGTREATLGVALRGRNLGVIAERSFRIDRGGRSGFRLFGYAGVTQVLPDQFRLEGYGQAGVSSGQTFADGALAIEHTLMAQSNIEVSAGASSWASIQSGARRLDVGPQLVARIPLAGQRFRVSAEWRVRVAGNANPGSGPSITLGTDF